MSGIETLAKGEGLEKIQYLNLTGNNLTKVTVKPLADAIRKGALVHDAEHGEQHHEVFPDLKGVYTADPEADSLLANALYERTRRNAKAKEVSELHITPATDAQLSELKKGETKHTYTQWMDS